MTPSTSPGSSLHARTAPTPGPPRMAHVPAVWPQSHLFGGSPLLPLSASGLPPPRWRQKENGSIRLGASSILSGARSIWSGGELDLVGELHVELQLLPAARLPILVGRAHGWNLAFRFSPSRPPERWPRLARQRGTERWRNSHDQIGRAPDKSSLCLAKSSQR
jgi:hypothetical protein